MNRGSHAAALRHQLAETLIASGDLRSPEWRAAVDAVPRHEFVADFFSAVDPQDGSPTLYTPSSQLGSDERLAIAYSDDTLVTQLDGHVAPGEVEEPMPGMPTSSSTMPGLVVRMWEELEVRDGDRVLEIGTGTGYSTALGCHRLGDRNITSIEVDSTVAARARAALERVGYQPHVTVGDGLAGHPGRAPYDRIVATCAVRNIPSAWVEQCRPGAIIVATLSGWLDDAGLAKLTVTAPDRAEGTFIYPEVGFMPARSAAPEYLVIPKLDEELISDRAAQFGPEVFADPRPLRRVIQLVSPAGQHVQSDPGDDLPEHLFVESDESFVVFHPDQAAPSGWRIRQGGRRAIWDEAERAIAGWIRAGSPPLEAFRITITPGRQTVAFGPDDSWNLP
jgi:methyltransferase of ATP-grasp peptide maturase system